MKKMFGCLGVLLCLISTPVFAETPPADVERIQQLEERIRDLEEIVKDPEGTVKSTEAAVKKQAKISWSGYAQGRFQHNDNSKNGTSTVDDFHLRRIRLKLTAKPSAECTAVVSFDGAKGFELKDAFLVWIPGGSPENTPQFSLGQMNWCFGREVPVSSSVRECPERALFARSLFPGERDLGFKLTSEAGSRVQLELGVYNGTGLNKRDTNEGKDLVGRLSCAALPNLDIGVSGYWGTAFKPAAGEIPARNLVKNRYGADLQWLVRNGLVLKAEGVYARELGYNPWGYLVQLAQNLDPKTALVVRFDAYDHDGLSNAERTHTWDVGLIRHLTPNLRGKLFWDSPRDRVGDVKDDRIIGEVLAVF